MTSGLSEQELEDLIKQVNKKNVEGKTHTLGQKGTLEDVKTFLDRIRKKMPRHVKATRAKKVLSLEEVLADLLRVAARYGKIDIVKYLVETEGADVNKKRPETLTALRTAVKGSHVECVKFLLEAGADPNCVWYGYTLLVDAIYSVECVKLLISAGADVNEVNEMGRFPLQAAVDCWNAECVKVLLEAGANVNQMDRQRRTALMKAAKTGQTDSVKLLLESGADVNHRNENGERALMLAVQNGKVHCVKLLLDAGAEVNFVTHEKDSPLNCCWRRLKSLFVSCAKLTKTEAVVKLLLAAGAKVNFPERGTLTTIQHNEDKHRAKRERSALLALTAGEQNLAFRSVKHPSSEAIFFSEPGLDDLTLKNLSRRAIRKHLLSIDKHTNLFMRISRLQMYIPEILVSYLLFGCHLEVDWEELDRVSGR